MWRLTKLLLQKLINLEGTEASLPINFISFLGKEIYTDDDKEKKEREIEGEGREGRMKGLKYLILLETNNE